jgi:glutamyl-tRNA reductase
MNIVNEINLRYYAVTFNYKNIDISRLHIYYLNDEEIIKLKNFINNEMAVLQTCNRVEIYGYSNSNYDVRNVTNKLLNYLDSIHPYPISNKAKVLIGTDAIKHLFRVASGLESLSIGEYEILSQVKQSVERAIKTGIAGKYLRMLFERAIKTGKQVRNLTEISKGKVGTYSLAIELAEKELGNLENYKIAVIGAGEIASKLVFMLKNKVKDVVIINRTLNKAREIAEKFGYKYDILDFNKLYKYDIIFSAINNKDNMRYYFSEPKLIIDLSVPPVFYGDNVITLEGLRTLALINLKKRENEIKRAEEIIEENINRFLIDYENSIVNEIISTVMGRVEQIRVNEIERALKKIMKANSIEEIKEILDLMSKSMIKKMFEPVYSNIREMVKKGEFKNINLILEIYSNDTISDIKTQKIKAK